MLDNLIPTAALIPTCCPLGQRARRYAANSRMWIIDFGVDMQVEAAARYDSPLTTSAETYGRNEKRTNGNRTVSGGGFTSSPGRR